MTALPRNITFDCADPWLLLTFWSQVTGFQGDPEGGRVSAPVVILGVSQDDDPETLRPKPDLLFH